MSIPLLHNSHGGLGHIPGMMLELPCIAGMSHQINSQIAPQAAGGYLSTADLRTVERKSPNNRDPS